MSIKRKIYVCCMCLFSIGIVLRLALLRNGHPANQHVIEILHVLPWVFFVTGLLVWAQTWREWK